MYRPGAMGQFLWGINPDCWPRCPLATSLGTGFSLLVLEIIPHEAAAEKPAGNKRKKTPESVDAPRRDEVWNENPLKVLGANAERPC